MRNLINKYGHKNLPIMVGVTTVVIALVVGLVSYKKDSAPEIKEPVLKSEAVQHEVHTELPTELEFYMDNVDITKDYKFEYDEVDVTRTGAYPVMITYDEVEYPFQIDVVDTQAPTLELKSDATLVFALDSSVDDLKQLVINSIKVVDNYDKNIAIDEASLNQLTLPENEVEMIYTMIATDKSDNAGSLKITIQFTEDGKPKEGLPQKEVPPVVAGDDDDESTTVDKEDDKDEEDTESEESDDEDDGVEDEDNETDTDEDNTEEEVKPEIDDEDNVGSTDVLPTLIEVSPSELDLRVGDNAWLSVNVGPEDVTDGRVKFTSENPKVVSVTASGEVTAKAAGNTRIVVTSTAKPDIKGYVSVSVSGETTTPTLPSERDPLDHSLWSMDEMMSKLRFKNTYTGDIYTVDDVQWGIHVSDINMVGGLKLIENPHDLVVGADVLGIPGDYYTVGHSIRFLTRCEDINGQIKRYVKPKSPNPKHSFDEISIILDDLLKP